MLQINANKSCAQVCAGLIFFQPTYGYIAKDADNVCAAMSLDEKIGQLFMVATSVRPPDAPVAGLVDQHELKRLVRDYHIGGIIIDGHGRGNLTELASLIAKYQAYNKKYHHTRLLVGIDAEWGLAMRVDGCIKFPHNLTLGYVPDTCLIRALGHHIGFQLRVLGIDINFAPVADIYTNPRNPIINRRSFGHDVKTVTERAVAWMQGLQETGAIACAKHFPGHGDTAIDSHTGLPVIHHDRARIESVELEPFRALAQSGIKAIMTAHIALDAYDPGIPVTVSRHMVHDILRNQLGFTGLIITDSLTMSGVSSIGTPGDIAILAIEAGADILLYPADVPCAHAALKKVVIEGKISEECIDQRCRKILTAKADHERCTQKGVVVPTELLQMSTEQIFAIGNNDHAIWLSKQLYRSAVRVINNSGGLLPKDKQPVQGPLLCIQCGSKNRLATWHNELAACYSIANYIEYTGEPDNSAKILTLAHTTRYICVALAGITYDPDTNFGISQHVEALIESLRQLTAHLMLFIFGNAAVAQIFNRVPMIVIAHEEHDYAQEAAVLAIKAIVMPQGQRRVPVVSVK